MNYVNKSIPFSIVCNLPYNFNSSGTLHLSFFPHKLIPVEIKENHHNSRYLVKMLSHPRSL